MKYRYLGLWLMCFTLPVAAADRQDPVCADPCLKAAIAALYIRSPFLSPFKVDIQVKDSVATLRGSVSDAGERALAEEIARGLDGITAVINRIRVNPSISAERVTALPADCLTDDDALVARQVYACDSGHPQILPISPGAAYGGGSSCRSP